MYIFEDLTTVITLMDMTNTIRISLMPKLLTNVLFTRVCPRMKKPLTLTKCMYVSRHVPWDLEKDAKWIAGKKSERERDEQERQKSTNFS